MKKDLDTDLKKEDLEKRSQSRISKRGSSKNR